jgi:hypothetical protein
MPVRMLCLAHTVTGSMTSSLTPTAGVVCGSSLRFAHHVRIISGSLSAEYRHHDVVPRGISAARRMVETKREATMTTLLTTAPSRGRGSKDSNAGVGCMLFATNPSSIASQKS